MAKSYGQYCGLAHALDVLGGRWTLLIVRELITGPKRYKDLLDSLAGIGTNLLADRLHFLEEEGLIEKHKLPPPASSQVYVLTDRGFELEGVLLELVRWGHGSMGMPVAGELHRPHWNILALKAVFDPEKTRGVHAEYEYQIGDDVFHARVDDGRLETGQGHVRHPDFIMRADTDTFVRLISGAQDIDDALSAGTVIIEGDMQAFAASNSYFDLSVLQKTTDTR